MVGDDPQPSEKGNHLVGDDPPTLRKRQPLGRRWPPMPQTGCFDKDTKEYLGGTDSGSASDRDSYHPLFRGDSQDLSIDSDEVIET